jgi:hypothetical protein
MLETFGDLGEKGEQIRSEYEFIVGFRKTFLEHVEVNEDVILDRIEFANLEGKKGLQWYAKIGTGWYVQLIKGMERANDSMMIFFDASPVNVEICRKPRRSGSMQYALIKRILRNVVSK